MRGQGIGVDEVSTLEAFKGEPRMGAWLSVGETPAPTSQAQGPSWSILASLTPGVTPGGSVGIF